jgi:hypothetical protein
VLDPPPVVSPVVVAEPDPDPDPEPVAVIVTLNWPLAVSGVGTLESVTMTVKVKVPTVVGVPETRPVELAMLRPGGSDPAVIDQVYGGVPPVTVMVWE